jgi:hypothetical protein
VPALSAVARAGGSDDFGCSNATLQGEYAFGLTDYTSASLPNAPPYVVTVVNGIKVFDGHGNLTQRDYQGNNNAGPDFSPPGREKGTYQVNSDCTGSMVINLNVPVPTGSTGVIGINFVISDGGRHVHEVVSQFTPPGSITGPVSTKPALTTGRSRTSSRTERLDRIAGGHWLRQSRQLHGTNHQSARRHRAECELAEDPLVRGEENYD